MPTVELIPDGNNSYGTLWQYDYTAVDEGSSSPNDSDYIRSAVNNRKEFFNFTTSTDLDGKTISKIDFYYRAKKASNGGFIPQLYIGGTAYDGTTPTLTTSYANYYSTWTTNPADSAAWEKSDIDGLVAGFKVDIPRGIGNWAYVSNTWIIVTYVSAGYGNDVIGVASGDISIINGVATANISKVNGV